jgi:predicted Fe-S protein YdhL (DUF1289 family)
MIEMNGKITAIRYRSLSYNKVENTPYVRNCCMGSRRICLGYGRSLPEVLERHKTNLRRQQENVLSARRRLLSQAKTPFTHN